MHGEPVKSIKIMSYLYIRGGKQVYVETLLDYRFSQSILAPSTNLLPPQRTITEPPSFKRPAADYSFSTIFIILVTFWITSLPIRALQPPRGNTVIFCAYKCAASLQQVDYAQGQCHEMNIFSKVLKIKTILFEWTLIVFTIYGCLFVKKIQNKVFLCFYESTY